MYRQRHRHCYCQMGPTLSPPSSLTESQTDTCENITSPQLHWRLVKMERDNTNCLIINKR